MAYHPVKEDSRNTQEENIVTTPRWLIVGVSMLAVAVVLVALAVTSPAKPASAQFPDCGPNIDGPTCTPVRKVSTATPTFTVTVEPSSTPVPPTQAPPTQAPATATPTGAAGGQAVTPPNTGSGPDSGFSFNVYMLLAAGLVAAMGGGSIAVAARRSRRG